MKIFYEFFFILGILLSCFYIIVLYKSNKGLPSKILTAIFTIIIFILLESYGYINRSFSLFIFFYLPAACSKYFIGALLFLYIKSLFYNDKVVLKKYWMVLIPPILFLLLYATPYLTARISKKYFLGHVYFFENYNQYLRFFSNLVFFIYLILCYHSFLKLKKVMKCIYSNISYNNFIWIRYVLIASIIIISIDSVFVTFQLFFNTFKTFRTQNLTILSLVIFIINMAYYGLHQSKVLVPYFLLDFDDNNAKNKTLNLDTNNKVEFEKLEIKLNDLFKNEKTYLDTELTLNKLAKYIGTTDKKLSILLNQHMKISFYDYINNYRINEFKEALKSNRFNGYTIEGISNECGFNSKASFYRIFKLKTNMSPSEYKKSLI